MKPARLLVAPLGTHPGFVDDVIDLKKYDPIEPWRDFGAALSGVKVEDARIITSLLSERSDLHFLNITKDFGASYVLAVLWQREDKAILGYAFPNVQAVSHAMHGIGEGATVLMKWRYDLPSHLLVERANYSSMVI